MSGLNVTPAVAAAAVLVATEIPNLYSAPLPSMFTISSPFFHDQAAKDGNVKRIRQGELVATTEALLIGYASSVLFKSWLIFWAAAAMAAVQLGCYEYALRHPATEYAAKAGGDTIRQNPLRTAFGA